MTTQPSTRCQQAALLFAGVSCSILAFASWSPEAAAHPHAPGSTVVPHTHEGATPPRSTNPAPLWLAGLGCALLAVPASRRLRSQG
ncbi:MAG: hypothetical protein F4162_06995 [Synechococcus sp. SB0676_bin_10]|uniref:PTPA-CTERM sorting domain-containing protein n=1 Tax=Synechococcus sp. SB0676_bin_10 TaxID=2604869 RepID=A0A6B1F6V1_9SYNE|nr:hypothetical protein [Cyanobacteria bacterium MAG IRC3_bin_20]MYF21076.1 hypothetical protein [Synechococcus sp. SB0677_bin_5]MYG38701.1 hypothetical protein [Synechococcus sp. SB0676_bin_10]